MICIWREIFELEGVQTSWVKSFVVSESIEKAKEQAYWCQAFMERGKPAVTTAFALNGDLFVALIKNEIQHFVWFQPKELE